MLGFCQARPLDLGPGPPARRRSLEPQPGHASGPTPKATQTFYAFLEGSGTAQPLSLAGALTPHPGRRVSWGRLPRTSACSPGSSATSGVRCTAAIAGIPHARRSSAWNRPPVRPGGPRRVQLMRIARRGSGSVHRQAVRKEQRILAQWIAPTDVSTYRRTSRGTTRSLRERE